MFLTESLYVVGTGDKWIKPAKPLFSPETVDKPLKTVDNQGGLWITGKKWYNMIEQIKKVHPYIWGYISNDPEMCKRG